MCIIGICHDKYWTDLLRYGITYVFRRNWLLYKPHRWKDFTKEKTYSEIENDIRNKYKITNIGIDEEDNPLYEICEALCYDYEYKLANYEVILKLV